MLPEKVAVKAGDTDTWHSVGINEPTPAVTLPPTSTEPTASASSSSSGIGWAGLALATLGALSILGLHVGQRARR